MKYELYCLGFKNNFCDASVIEIWGNYYFLHTITVKVKQNKHGKSSLNTVKKSARVEHATNATCC